MKWTKRERDVCGRVREMRERLGLTQAACAERAGIERSALVNYELGRTPVKYDVGLRLCRQMIVSEEWLGTGRCDACREEALEMGFPKDEDWRLIEGGVFFRQCMDLLSEPTSLHIAPGTLYSEAYDKTLQRRYRELVREFFHYPRLRFSDADKPELAVELMKVVNERQIVMLMSMECRKQVPGADPAAWRVYTREMVEASHLIFQRMMGKDGVKRKGVSVVF